MALNYINSFISQHWGTYTLQLVGIVILVWTLPWKGYSLWTAARKGQKYWFIALLLLNTLAILEILYIFIFSKLKKDQKAEPNTDQKQIKLA